MIIDLDLLLLIFFLLLFCSLLSLLFIFSPLLHGPDPLVDDVIQLF